MKISDTEAHVCLGDKEVKVGDKVTAFKNACHKVSLNNDRTGNITPCQKTLLGKGEVTSLINDHYSVVKFESNVDFNEGTIIELNK